jgi:glycosyltransferase involved in cell wall biosynthesis
MRVTHLASGDLWAGAENQLHNLVLALHRTADVDVDVVLLNEGLLAERLREAGVAVTIFPETELGGAALLARIRRHLLARRTDVLHTHRYKENVLGAFAAALTSRTRSTRTLHGAPEFNAPFWQFRKSVPQWLDWFTARFLQFPIVCVSAELLERRAQSLPPNRLRVVANGVDLDSLRRAELPASASLPAADRPFRVAFFGRLMPVKRIDVIVETAAVLERESPGQFSIQIFGEGPLQSDLEEQVRRLGLEAAVHFMGFTSQPAAWLRRMHGLVLTSDHEGLPMIVLEAMALGVPVISHAVGAIPEVLGAGAMGTLISNQDPSSYAKAITALRDEPDAIRARTDRASRQVESRYSAAHTVREYLSIYRELGGNTRKSASA